MECWWSAEAIGLLVEFWWSADGVLWSAGGLLVECQWQSQPVLQQAVRLSPWLRSRAPFLHSFL